MKKELTQEQKETMVHNPFILMKQHNKERFLVHNNRLRIISDLLKKRDKSININSITLENVLSEFKKRVDVIAVESSGNILEWRKNEFCNGAYFVVYLRKKGKVLKWLMNKKLSEQKEETINYFYNKLLNKHE